MLFKKDEEDKKPVKRVKIERDRNIQTNLKKSLKFQKCVGALFPQDQFELLETTQREDGSPIPESIRKLDDHFQDKSTGKSFWVECRFRQHLTNRNELQWTTENFIELFRITKFLRYFVNTIAGSTAISPPCSASTGVGSRGILRQAPSWPTPPTA